MTNSSVAYKSYSQNDEADNLSHVKILMWNSTLEIQRIHIKEDSKVTANEAS